MNSDVRTKETEISFDNVRDAVAAFLTSCSMLEFAKVGDIVDIEFYGEPREDPVTKKTLLPIRIKYTKEGGV